MRARRYTVIVADRSSGLVRRFTLSLRPAILVCAGLASLPILMGLGANWKAQYAIDQLRAENTALEVENSSYRSATGELTSQIQSLEGVVDDLGSRAKLDPAAANAIRKLPAAVRQRAAGGPMAAKHAVERVLELTHLSRRHVRRAARPAAGARKPAELRAPRRRAARGAGQRHPVHLADARRAHRVLRRPQRSRSPASRAITRASTSRRKRVSRCIATADGVVEAANYSGDYGNLVVVKHAFGLATRFGHLSAFGVAPGQSVKRGDVIGYVGSTGRSTGAHLHYEILVNGRLINPLQLLTQPATR